MTLGFQTFRAVLRQPPAVGVEAESFHTIAAIDHAGRLRPRAVFAARQSTMATQAKDPHGATRPGDRAENAWQRIGSAYRCDESEALKALCADLPLDAAATARIDQRALDLAREVRAALAGDVSAEAFLRHYGLSTGEGVVLMCIAEALLRIPDAQKADELIRDKLGQTDWGSAIGNADSLLVNASTWALMLTGRLVEWQQAPGDEPLAVLRRLVGRSSEPIIRAALQQAMRVMAEQFVMGQTSQDALRRTAPLERQGYRASYDMLDEAALSAADAQRYFHHYADAIDVIAASATQSSLVERPGISVKLSALH